MAESSRRIDKTMDPNSNLPPVEVFMRPTKTLATQQDLIICRKSKTAKLLSELSGNLLSKLKIVNSGNRYLILTEWIQEKKITLNEDMELIQQLDKWFSSGNWRKYTLIQIIVVSASSFDAVRKIAEKQTEEDEDWLDQQP